MMCPVCPDLPKMVSKWNLIKKFVYKKRAKKSAVTPMTVTDTVDEGIKHYQCKYCYYGFRA